MIKISATFQKYPPVLFGTALCFALTYLGKIFATYLSIPAMPTCLILGVALHALYYIPFLKSGINFTAQTILRIGVVLIASRIVFSDFITLGAGGILIVITATTLACISSLIFATLLKLEHQQAILIGGATAICGASAALAISSVLPKTKTLENDTLITILSVTAIGTLSMLLSPFITSFLGYTDHQAGVFIGGTIHDVSQVVGAGYTISQEAGDTAILIKLIRVFLLIPLLIICALYFKKDLQKSDKSKFPLFILWFAGFAALNSFHIVPQFAVNFCEPLSSWFLTAALLAVGMKTPLKSLGKLGWKPVALVIVDTLALGLIYVFALHNGGI